MKRNNDRPLIEQAEGIDADNRASLYSAFRRLANRADRAPITNLHVRELLMWVMVADRNGSGVQKSYPELANILETTVATARAVVRRASSEFGLLAIIEERHSRGGQTANRYSIDWPVVREVNSGARPAVATRHANREQVPEFAPEAKPSPSCPPSSNVTPDVDGCSNPGAAWQEAEEVASGGRPVVVSQQAPVVSRHGPVATRQGPVVPRQPYKEQVPEFRPEAKANTSPSCPPASTVAPDVEGCNIRRAAWSEVEEVAAKVLVKWKPAIRGARENGLTPEQVLAIVAHQQNPDHRLGPGALYERLVNGHRSIAPDAGWPQSQTSGLASILAQSGGIRAGATTRAHCVISEVVARGRREGRSEAEIERAINRRLEHEGLERPE